MAAQAHAGAGAVQEGVALVEKGVKAEASVGGAMGTSAQEADEDAAANKDDDDDLDGAVWETASLFEEILDDVAAFEYSSNSMYSGGRGHRAYINRW